MARKVTEEEIEMVKDELRIKERVAATIESMYNEGGVRQVHMFRGFEDQVRPYVVQRTDGTWNSTGVED